MPEENPAPSPAPEPTPTITPEPTAPAPVAPTAPKKPKTGLIVGICATVAIAITGTVIAIIMINNNKPKEPTLGDLMNNALESIKSGGDDDDKDSGIDWSKLFDDDDEKDKDDDEDSSIDWSKLFDDEDDDKDDDKDSSTSKITSCKDAFDCMEKLDKGYTKVEIDKITGITGKPAYEGSTSSYEWEFPNGDKLKYYISEYSLDVEVEYEKNNYKDSSVDFSSYKSIESNIKSGDVKYKDLVKEFGTEGKLFKRSDYRNGYFWVNANGGYIEANVSNETQQVQSAFGIIR
ncbi:hypothetical protein J6T21_03500 [Candidatus Saccharibacteria bacterium]|nr:hypothetical protein [Candidatus Saccharibacteria bacterium]